MRNKKPLNRVNGSGVPSQPNSRSRQGAFVGAPIVRPSAIRREAVMNRLPREKQVAVISGLVEGCSVRSVERLTGVHRDTILRLLVRVGTRCEEIMAERVKGVRVES